MGALPYQFFFDGSQLKLKADPTLCVSVREGKVGDGSDIILWTCASADGFRWKFENDMIYLHDDQNYCLSVREGKAFDGSDLILWSCDKVADDQKFVLVSERFRYKAKKHYCISVREGRAGDGSNIILWS